MLTLDELATAKGMTVAELAAFGAREANGIVEIPYRLPDGTEHARVRLRTDVIAKAGSRWSHGDAPLVPYGLDQPVKIDDFVFIVEGESDCWSLWLAGLPAIGIPGASNGRCVGIAHIASANKVYVVQEPGEAGNRFPHQVALALHDGGFTGTVAAIQMPPPYKDPQAAFAADRATLKDVMRGAVKGAAPLLRAERAAPDKSKVLSFDDLARRSDEKIDWLIEGMLRRSGILLMASRPKVGKSDTARNLAKGVATGGFFLDRRCQQGTVLWLGLEEPVPHLRDRIEVMGMGSLPVTYVVERPDGDESGWLKTIVEDYKPDLVIIDTIGRFSKIEDVNNYSQVARATQPMLDMRTRLGTSFVLLHHNNAADTPLGSTMWEGMVDTILSISRSPSGDRFAKTKQRSGIDMPPTALTIDPDTGSITCKESAFIADQRVAEQKILEYLGRVESGTREELAQRSGRKSYIGRSAVDALFAANLISSKGTGTKGDPRIYQRPTPRMLREKKIVGLMDEEPGAPEESSRGITEETTRTKNPEPPQTIPKNTKNLVQASLTIQDSLDHDRDLRSKWLRECCAGKQSPILLAFVSPFRRIPARSASPTGA